MKLLFGFGVNDVPLDLKSSTPKEYKAWYSMLRRCYSATKDVKFKAYEGCTVSDTFKMYSNFKKWCHSQVGFNNIGWHLDKDLLVKGNKVYSPETCCFLPPEINILIVCNKTDRGTLPIGVTQHRKCKNYQAQLRMHGKVTYLGMFKTPEEAFQAYKQAKESYIKEVALKYKDQLAPDVYNTLCHYVVDIDD